MYEIGGEEFETKKAIKERAREIRERYTPGERISSEADWEWVKALLDRGMEHIDGWGWDTEWAKGFSDLKVDHNTGGTTSFYIVREDGTTGDFGVENIVKSLPNPKK